MPRSFTVPGECMVSVKGGEQMSGGPIAVLSELGLASDSITVTPTYYHKDVLVDDFGPNVPADLQQYLAEVRVSMTLIHFDPSVLDLCANEALGGGDSQFVVNTRPAGEILAPTGRLLGRFRNRFWSGWHYVGLNLSATDLATGWRFFQATLTGQPFIYPMGTEAAGVRLEWRCLPYCSPWLSGGTLGRSGAIQVGDIVWHPRNEMQSSGATIWDRGADTSAADAEFPTDLPLD